MQKNFSKSTEEMADADSYVLEQANKWRQRRGHYHESSLSPPYYMTKSEVLQVDIAGTKTI